MSFFLLAHFMSSSMQGIVNVIYEIRTNAFKKETKTDFANCNVKIKLILGNKEKKKICSFDWLVGWFLKVLVST